MDHAEQRNYLRTGAPGGTRRIWISDPDEKNPGPYWVKLLSTEEIPVKDSPHLLPVDIPAGKNVQFWITVHVPADAASGQYAGEIRLISEKVRVGALRMELEVLPFALASPKTHYDLNTDFVSSVYYRSRFHPDYPDAYAAGSVSSEYKSEAQLEAELKDLLSHGITNPVCHQGFSPDVYAHKAEDVEFNAALLEKYLRIRGRVGMAKDALFIRPVDTWPDFTPEFLESVKEKVTEVIRIAQSHGFSDVYFYGVDEAAGEGLTAQRAFWSVIHEAGGKIFVAGRREQNFALVGDIQDLLVCGGKPYREEAEKWHSVGHKIWCYGYPQACAENPERYRRNYGLLLWKADYDGACTFAYQCAFGNVWNDFDHARYRDVVFVYPTVDGVIGTIAFEGYREAIDDIRYATTLKLAIERARTAGTKTRGEIASEAVKWLSEVDVEKADLDAVRRRMIDFILKLVDVPVLPESSVRP